MSVKNIVDRVSRLATLVNGWSTQGSVPRIERDMALDELRRLYDAVLDVESNEKGTLFSSDSDEESDAEQSTVAVAEAPKDDTSTSNFSHDPIADFDDALDIDALLGITAEEKPHSVAQPTAEPASLTQPTAEPTALTQPAAEPSALTQPAEESTSLAQSVEQQTEVEAKPNVARGGGLFDIEDIPVRTRSSRKMISLYSSPITSSTSQTAPRTSAPITQPPTLITEQPNSVASAPQVVSQHMEQPQRLGDVLGGGRKVVGEITNVDSVPTPPMTKIVDLRKAIGINDKFIMLRDLFAGNEQLYNTTLNTLNSFADLDECMIYIVENFTWNPDSEGAKLIVSLIERKLS